LAGGLSGVECHHLADQAAFHLRQHRAHALLVLVQGQELLFHRRAQLAEVGSGQGAAYGNEHIRTGLDQHAFVHRHVDLARRLGLVNQDARCQRRHAIEPPRQDAECTLARLGDDAGHAGCVGKDLEGQEDLKVHQR